LPIYPIASRRRDMSAECSLATGCSVVVTAIVRFPAYSETIAGRCCAKYPQLRRWVPRLLHIVVPTEESRRPSATDDISRKVSPRRGQREEAKPMFFLEFSDCVKHDDAKCCRDRGRRQAGRMRPNAP